MQNKNFKLKVLEQKRPQKAARVVTPIIRSRILFTHQSKYNENTKVSSSHNLVVPFVEGNGGAGPIKDMSIDKLQAWKKSMQQTFEGFLLQLDELFINLRTEQRFKNMNCLSILNCYKDTCEHLRLEILIAIDKLELPNFKANKNILEMEFLDKMNGLKSQLTQIRGQYHHAIQELHVCKK